MSNIGNKTVCFAEVPETMRSFKENLVKELEQYGWIIKELSYEKQPGEKSLEILEQCKLAIHILSDKDESSNSQETTLEEQQINQSVQYLKSKKLLTETTDPEFKIFVWRPKSSAESIFEEEIIPEYLHRIQQLDEIEFLRTNFEDFKYYLLSQMEADAGRIKDEIQREENGNLNIYFLYNMADEELATKYIEYLKKNKYSVCTPGFGVDLIETRQKHHSCLMKMDVAFIFAEAASVNWVNMKIMDILKSPGLGKENKILGKAVISSTQNENGSSLMLRGFDFFLHDQNSINRNILNFLKTKQKLDS